MVRFLNCLCWNCWEKLVVVTVESIEHAVAKLPPAELAKFRQWFAEFDAAAWDKQSEADVAAGKLAHLAAEALAEYNAGNVREI